MLDGEIVYIEQQSDNYIYSLQSHRKLGLLKFRLGRILILFRSFKTVAIRLKLVPIDQTSIKVLTLAQICIILRKKS